MLTAEQISLVKSTLPLLSEAGRDVTDYFYNRMFNQHPELKNIFNMSNQRSGRQPLALFNALAAYATHIDNLPVLQQAVERIAQKHASMDIQPEQYDIVGHHLIETLKELAPNEFTPDVEDAWRAAYQQLASVFIQREKQIYDHNAQQTGGWRGARNFRLLEKHVESELVTSLILAPVDDSAIASFQPGQYIGVRIETPQGEYDRAIRQYSISDKPNGSTYRISVKREAISDNSQSPGLVSNYLHDQLNPGDEIELFAPTGEFFLQPSERPIVLISAGVGLTPMMSMLETLADQKTTQPVFWLHACENQQQHSFQRRIHELSECLSLQQYTWYNQQTSATEAMNNSTGRACYNAGLMNLEPLREQLPVTTGDFYLCGPIGFMQFAYRQLLQLGVSQEHIYYETFGPHQTLDS
ncbi:NO-inducible flavohemoprotein [Oceanospirillum sediminis]|uniref:Flavohemoprotein n=1 Tax=Oceanospirillum sediminis TaxID=2760088 RepID=A0A839INK7_9GAMM|nr:NO-inducible flavohemoprotein [Oceanospirillum sediminis]MBB1486280.1 NO-inducible flavohemoprotein [Oceanospirillum sediminis]